MISIKHALLTPLAFLFLGCGTEVYEESDLSLQTVNTQQESLLKSDTASQNTTKEQRGTSTKALEGFNHTQEKN
jgi:hypothetical protein